MHKRKYTKEQLEFYFKQLMNKLKRIPREEDLSRSSNMPSVKAYTDRFGSWKNAVNMFADFELAKRKCLNCGKVLVKKSKTQKFCSRDCSKKYSSRKLSRYTLAIERKINALLGGKCFVCDFEHITEIHCLDNKPESHSKILKAYNKKSLHEYVLLCPNHHQMIHSKMAYLRYSNDELCWEERQ